MSSFVELLHRSQAGVSTALSEARSSYDRGMIALDEKRFGDAEKELKHCNMFMKLMDLFEHHVKAYEQFMKGNIPTHEIEEQVRIIQEIILKI